MPDRGTVLVVGGGSAGTSAARRLADAGLEVTLAEPDRPGGSAVWRACIPANALRRSAAVLGTVSAAEEFGVIPGEIALDWQSVLAWKWHAQETYAGDQRADLESRGIDFVEAPARFVSPDVVEAGRRVFSPDHVIVCTGSEPIVLGVPGAELADSSEGALHYAEPPETLTVVGGGRVGMEFASSFAAFGTRVTVVCASDRVLPHVDEEVAEPVIRAMRARGVDIFPGSCVTAIETDRGRLRTYFDTRDQRRAVDSAKVLMAVGRRPALAPLDLAAARVEVDESGSPVLDESLRSKTNPRVWFAGDAAGAAMLTPLASDDGRSVATSIVTGRPLGPDRVVPAVTFTIPPIGQVGLTEREARAAGLAVHVGRRRFDSLGAAIVSDERPGLVKLLFAQDDGRLVGGHVAGSAAPELAWALALAVRMRATADDMRATLGVHPSFCEALNSAAWD